MKIDLHVHSKNGSDGRWPLEQIFAEAARRGIGLISVTDHDSLKAQDEARRLALHHGIRYLTGVELNVTITHERWTRGKAASLDLLGYGFDIGNKDFTTKLDELRNYRKRRAQMILDNLNEEFHKEGRPLFTVHDMEAIEESVDGSFGRPHIAGYLISKGIVASKQEAFDRYLVKCDVPKMPLAPEEASSLVRSAGGRLVIAHPNDPNGTSLAVLTTSLAEQARMIEEVLLPFIDGIECWHTRHDAKTSSFYREYAREHHLIVTGGSDCHQQPVLMGSVDVPDCVAEQFGL
ncbi:MAG TPA: PHP domain-containing protein [Deltaproteobacteria bacterium]|nr:PHP domain-containing protein [Deltaproteobacteria bacterium]HXK46006.1 PHP domain-containing protein [Deltaproteobacteria bacterium]